MEGIDASRLTLQLIDVCRYSGATYERIEEQAPLLLELPATQHAHEVLYKSQAGQRPEAARQVLECVIRPDGAARLNQRDSRLVAAYLGLNGAAGSLTARLDDLDNDPDYLYGRAPATRSTERRKFMRRLAAALVALESYPCAPPSPDEEKLDIAAGFWAVLFPEFGELAPEGQDEQIHRFFRRVKHARAVFDEHEPVMSTIDRLKVVIRAVAVGPYRKAYNTLSLASREAVLSPDAWLGLLDSTTLPNRIPTNEELERTSEIMARVVLDIESDAAWERVLLVAESERDPFELSQTQMLRIQALVAKSIDGG